MIQVLVEQVVYSPFAISTFYIGIGLLEGRKLEETFDEVKAKFIPTYKASHSLIKNICLIIKIHISLYRIVLEILYHGIFCFI